MDFLCFHSWLEPSLAREGAAFVVFVPNPMLSFRLMKHFLDLQIASLQSPEHRNRSKLHSTCFSKGKGDHYFISVHIAVIIICVWQFRVLFELTWLSREEVEKSNHFIVPVIVIIMYSLSPASSYPTALLSNSKTYEIHVASISLLICKKNKETCSIFFFCTAWNDFLPFWEISPEFAFNKMTVVASGPTTWNFFICPIHDTHK